MKRKKRFTVKDNKLSKGGDEEATENLYNDGEDLFISGTAIHPSTCIRLEAGSEQLTARAIDLICPIGLGQRGLIVAPPGSGKTTILKHICQSVAKAYPEIKLYVLLIDERPEEVTDFKRSVTATVYSSSSDDSYIDHARTANQLLKTACEQVSEGRDVMILIDSLTRLTRAHNVTTKTSGRTMSGGVDAGAMAIPRKLFGAARNIENGGSLTILATVLVDTGSRMDQVIFEEFKGTGNMEIVLSREIANHRIFPAIDISKSSTRHEELLLNPKDIQKINVLRRALTGLKPIDGARKLNELLAQSKSNEALLSEFSF